MQNSALPWTRCFQKWSWKGLWVSVQSRGPFSLQGWVSHHGRVSLGQEPGQALLAGVVAYCLNEVLLPKHEQGQV